MKRKLLVILAIVAVTCWAAVAVADPITIPLNLINSTNPPAVAGAPPYVNVNISLSTETHVATFTFVSTNPLLMFGQGAVSINLAFTPTIGNLTLLAPPPGANIDPGFSINGPSGSPFGSFVVSYKRFDGPDHGYGSNTFTIQISGVPISITDPSQLLVNNASGHSLSAHIWIPTAGGNLTLYVTNGPLSAVPIPPTALLLGTGLVGLAGLGWRRRRG